MWVIDAATHQGFGARAREVWQYRRILGFFSRKAAQTLYAKTVLGPWWILIRTLVPLGVGSFVFGSVMKVPSGGVPYFLFFLVGQIPWNCFDGPVVRGSRGLEANRVLLTKLYIPRIILPLAQMTPGVIEPIVLLVTLLVTLGYYGITKGVWYVQPTIRLAAAVASIALVLAFAFSLTIVTAAWQARARDVRFAVRYAVGFWLYLTPVIYPLSVVPADLRWVMHLNPLTAPIETFRWATLAGFEHSWPWFGYSVAITVLTFVAGAWHFGRIEATTVDKI
jgi:lipopolysaccharide transport system permease protein